MIRVPLSGVDLYDWMALRRVSDGGVARLGEWWLDWGHRVPGYVTDALAELCRRELVVLRDPNPTAGCMARGALTDSGACRYEQLCWQRKTALRVSALQCGASCARLAADGSCSAGTRPVTLAEARHPRAAPRHRMSAGLRIPDPQFPTNTPAGRRSSGPTPHAAPGGQPDPSSGAKGSGIEQLRWARCPDETSRHLMPPGDVLLTDAEGHAQVLCGQRVSAEGRTFDSGVSGALCLTCVIGIPAETLAPIRRAASPQISGWPPV